MNEKGFAATGILYTILILFILLMSSILIMLYSRNNLLNTIKNQVKSELEGVKPFYVDSVLNGADPVLSGDLIPVVIADDGIVTKADTKSTWYSYSNQRWANAVILKDKSVIYEDDQIIPEENIESYFVWIPRYRYQLFYPENYSSVIESKPTTSLASTINIQFETSDVAISTGTSSGEWLTHPAFTSFGVNGLWVGKFETGYDGATSIDASQVSSNDSSKIIIKPNAYIWRSNIVSNIFTAAYNYNRVLDSHMIKNTEWGAVAYLSHSVYGIKKEVNVNNNSNYITGYSASTDGKSFAYNTTIGYTASTTGNISGVYDMSGGSNEYVAAYMSNTLGSSGFTATSISEYNNKYFDVYSSSTTTSYNKRILGDSIGEMGPFYYYTDTDGTQRYHNSWYNDGSHFISSTNPWLGRGGYYKYGSLVAGQFAFGQYSGGVQTYVGSRLVLAP